MATSPDSNSHSNGSSSLGTERFLLFIGAEPLFIESFVLF